jgi:hypothetical protein
MLTGRSGSGSRANEMINEEKSMNTEQFQDLLDRHGADFGRWPTDDRARAEQLIIDNAEARALLKQTQRFDAALGQLIGRQKADDAAVLRVVARLNARPLPRQRVPLWRLPAMLPGVGLVPAWPRVAALCACAVIGFFVGMSGLDRSIDGLDQGDQIDAPFLSATTPDLGAVFGPDTQGETLP